MGKPAKANGLSIWSSPPVLRSERRADFDALVEALTREIKPRGIIEEMYVNEVACATWEIFRLRRCKTALTNAACSDAARTFIEGVLKSAGMSATEAQKEARDLGERWRSDEQVRKDMRKKVRNAGLEISTIEGHIVADIEAEAIRNTFRDLELLDKMLMTFEARRDKALVFVAHYRASFALQLRQSADRIIETQVSNVPRVEDASVKAAPD